MQSTKVDNGQTYFDIALIHYGSVVYASDIAHANAGSVTDAIGGTTINLPDIINTADDKKNVIALSKLTTPPATNYPE